MRYFLYNFFRRKMEKYIVKLKIENIETFKKTDLNNLNLKYYELF